MSPPRRTSFPGLRGQWSLRLALISLTGAGLACAGASTSSQPLAWQAPASDLSRDDATGAAYTSHTTDAAYATDATDAATDPTDITDTTEARLRWPHERLPSWALVDTRHAGSHEIGIGSGATLEQATHSALRDIAARISISIESRLSQVYSEIGSHRAESLEQVIETRVLETRFSDWERTRTTRVDGTFWVEVRIDRVRLVREAHLELEEQAHHIDARLEATTGSALRHWAALQATALARERVSSLILLLDAFDPDFERARWQARRVHWQRQTEMARRGLIFEVRADPASQEIARWLEAHLESESWTTRPGSCDSADAVCIDIRSQLIEADLASRHVAQIRSWFAVLEPNGRLVQERRFSGLGDSQANRGRARRKALDRLFEDLAASPVLDELITPPGP